jgi:hypothetical protein
MPEQQRLPDQLHAVPQAIPLHALVEHWLNLSACTGLNNNAYQISRALYHNNLAGHGLTETCRFVKADFMKQPFEDNSFDAVYEIDATCHAPDQVGCYKVRAQEVGLVKGLAGWG